MIQKIGAFFMAIVSFFNILFAGYIRYCPNNRIFLDQSYADSRNVRQQYDLVFPKDASGEMGIVLCIHGGGWIQGSKKDYTSTIMRASEEYGLAAACINYRYVSETVDFDDILDDITAALQAIQKQGEQYGVRFNKALLTGISAGGHLSLLYAYTRQNEAPIKPACVVELCGPTNFEDAYYYADDSSLAKAVGADYFPMIIGHGVDFAIDRKNLDAARTALKQYSPVNFVTKDSVPTVFGHGVNDELVPYQNALDLDAKLTACGVEHTFISFPNSGHACEDKASRLEIMKLFFSYADKYLK